MSPFAPFLVMFGPAAVVFLAYYAAAKLVPKRARKVTTYDHHPHG